MEELCPLHEMRWRPSIFGWEILRLRLLSFLLTNLCIVALQLEYTKKQGTKNLHFATIFKLGYIKKQDTKHLDSAIIFEVLAIILLLHACWYKCLTDFLIIDVCTVEFRKRGLPHAHMLIWLKQNYKCYSAVDIDSIISAELPNKTVNYDLYNIVTQFMIHGPCGQINPHSPCMREGKCSKSFPKQYKSETIFETNGYPVYKRRDDPTKFVIKNGMQIDNSFVVPYNSKLLQRYNAHINVESCCQSMLIKYLFKYINKGSDRARVVFQENQQDEILAYLNCRYISPYEAVWRLFQYPIHFRKPSVERLPIHLPLEQNIIFNGDQSLQSIVNRKNVESTMLTSWFEANKTFHEARTLTYAEFPSKFVWDSRTKMWKPRKKKRIPW
ncbi:uncharacterized protein LOC117612739 isoform X1 [Prunus dulcis]|uniref:uncharacterized protein LOC117612739 isoform X1 n=1 Tax=Prunus dulcis TaxID=3755 RepID=UPI0014822C29|nr:uncharacterized protein LOC117612739 isoform X1 [Prunus dulcis]